MESTVSRIPRGVILAEPKVRRDAKDGALNLVEEYAEGTGLPRDLVSEAVCRLVWEPTDGDREYIDLEEVICARKTGATLHFVEKGMERIVGFEFGDTEESGRFLEALMKEVNCYVLQDGSETYAVESQRKIRRVRRSILELDSDVPTSYQRRSPILLLRVFAELTAAAREAVERFTQDRENSASTEESQEREIPSSDICPPPMVARSHKRGRAVSLEKWKLLEKEDSPIDSLCVRHAIFLGGLEPSARPDAWPVIAGVFDWNTVAQDTNRIHELEEEYSALGERWKQKREELDDRSDLETAMEDSSDWWARLKVDRVRILKDVPRTDREVDVFAADDSPGLEAMRNILTSYALHNGGIGYCQGMSDILAPIIYVYGPENEVLSFWTFEKLMKKLQRNFRTDQSGIKEQLEDLRKLVEISDSELHEYFQEYDPNYYSCFRWILVQLKRELPFQDVLRLWEVLWLEHLGENFHIYIVVGLLRLHRQNLLRLGGFDDLVRYINDMSMHIDLDGAIDDAVKLYRQVNLAPSSAEK